MLVPWMQMGLGKKYSVSCVLETSIGEIYDLAWSQPLCK